MIELIIKNHLDQVLNTLVFFEYPENAPEFFVLIEKTSSGRNNRLDNSTFVFQSYAPSMYEAAELNEKVKFAVDSLIELSEISKVRLNSDYNFTDITRKKYRYQAVYDIYHY